MNATSLSTQYEGIINFIFKVLEDDDYHSRKQAMDIYITLHMEKIFEIDLNLTKILKKKITEQPKNFLEILFSFGNHLMTNPGLNFNFKQSLVLIAKSFFEKNMEYINSSETLVIKIYGLILNFFPIEYYNTPTNFLNYKQNFQLLTTNQTQNTTNQISNLNEFRKNNCVSFEIEGLYKTYIKVIYNTSHRKALLKHILKLLNNGQLQLDKIENSIANKKETQLKSISSKDSDRLNSKQINAIIISLIEFSEHNCDLFELMFSNFQEISQTLFAFLISSVNSFRMLMNRVLINFSYFIPSWRTQLLTLILNLTSVSHAEVASLKNVIIFLYNI